MTETSGCRCLSDLPQIQTNCHTVLQLCLQELYCRWSKLLNNLILQPKKTHSHNKVGFILHQTHIVSSNVYSPESLAICKGYIFEKNKIKLYSISCIYKLFIQKFPKKIFIYMFLLCGKIIMPPLVAPPGGRLRISASYAATISCITPILLKNT